MKGVFKRFAAMFLALSMMLGISAAAFDSNVVSETGTISVDLAVQKQGSDFTAAYTATMSMPDKLAEYCAVNAGIDATLKALRFTCVLEDALVKQYTNPQKSDFTFTGDGAKNFEYIGISHNGNGIEISYKLAPAVVDSWKSMGAEAIKASLVKSMTMKSNNIAVTSTQMAAALDSNNQIKTNARVDLAMQGGGDIPFYNQPVVTGAIGYDTTTVSIGGGTPSGGGGSSTPTYKITLINSSSNGSIASNYAKAPYGTTIVITSTASEGYRLTALEVKAANGNTVKVTKTGDSTYSFTMPASDVTVEPTYAAAIADPSDTGVGSLLNTDDHIAYMFGDNHGNFRPNAMITRAEVCQIFYNLMRDKNRDQSVTFNDVDPNQWYAPAVNTMATMGIVNGVGNGKFEPNRSITRAEFATIVARFAKEAKNGFNFNDVPETHWAYSYISTAAAYGWIGGVGNNKFEPDRSILRTEAAALVNHMLGRIPDKAAIDAGEARAWPDVDKSHWGFYEIGEATTEHKCTFNADRTKETWTK